MLNGAAVARHLDRIEIVMPGGDLSLDIEHADISPQELFQPAARNNPKRAFLFLSKVLGKHLPVRPSALSRIHAMLASKIGFLPEPVLFVGMAETATGLGQGVFEAWLAQGPGRAGLYLATTRYRARGARQFGFEEAHSHAPRLLLHEPTSPRMRELLARARSMVLIDDEVSTGNTFVNLASTCRVLAPLIEEIQLVTITDFMGRACRAELVWRMPARVCINALLTGQWQFRPRPWDAEAIVPAQAREGAEVSLDDRGFGRLGRISKLELNPLDVKRIGHAIVPGARVLVLGTGEFMHAPAVLARALEAETRCLAWTHATTRSPILAWGPITGVLTFQDNYGEGISNYLYNLTEQEYDHILVCHETPPSQALSRLAQTLGARLVQFRSEDHLEDASLL